MAYASRALTSIEQRYAQIEKEILAVTWMCQRFSQYLVGKAFTLQTDHKPLVTLLSDQKSLDELPPRIQKFRMKLLRFQYFIEYVPGKELVEADALSRSPVGQATWENRCLQEETELSVTQLIASLPASDQRLQEIHQHQQTDR